MFTPFSSLLQYYEGRAQMLGGLSRANYNTDRFHSQPVLMMSSGAVVNWPVFAISSSLIASTSSIF